MLNLALSCQESFGAIRTVRSFGKESFECGRYGEKVDESLKLGIKQAVRLSTEKYLCKNLLNIMNVMLQSCLIFELFDCLTVCSRYIFWDGVCCFNTLYWCSCGVWSTFDNKGCHDNRITDIIHFVQLDRLISYNIYVMESHLN